MEISEGLEGVLFSTEGERKKNKGLITVLFIEYFFI